MIASSNNLQLRTTILGNAKMIRVKTKEINKIDDIKINVFMSITFFSVLALSQSKNLTIE